MGCSMISQILNYNQAFSQFPCRMIRNPLIYMPPNVSNKMKKQNDEKSR